MEVRLALILVSIFGFAIAPAVANPSKGQSSRPSKCMTERTNNLSALEATLENSTVMCVAAAGIRPGDNPTRQQLAFFDLCMTRNGVGAGSDAGSYLGKFMSIEDAYARCIVRQMNQVLNPTEPSTQPAVAVR